MQGISKTLRGKPVIGHVTLSLDRGEMICLAGPSGVGKTTLLEIAAGMTDPDRGTVLRHSNRIGCVFQDTPLLPWTGAMDNMDFFLSRHMPLDKRRKAAKYWLEKMGLADAARKRPAEMSGGMKRRLAIACSFALEPDILLLDEPLAFLDDHWQRRIAREIADLHARRSTAILLVSHQLAPFNEMGATMIHIRSTPVIIGPCR
jgi:ABC-type nitrate/sulfonate/bicarbonate transport system ATPase subunit